MMSTWDDKPNDYESALAEIEQLRTALAAERELLLAVLADIAEYERVNNLAPNPGRAYCWDSIARAYAAIRKGE